jgi:hypothetical protein
MTASQLLLVERCSGQGLLSRLLEEVNTIFASFFPLLLHVLDHSWRVEFDVDSLCSVDQEEGCEADKTIWSGV